MLALVLALAAVGDLDPQIPSDAVSEFAAWAEPVDDFLPWAPPPPDGEDFSPPPLLPVEPVPPPEEFSPPPLLPAPEGPPEEFSPPPMVQLEGPLRPYAMLNRLELCSMQTGLSLQIANFDTSGPGWARGLRWTGYLLALPAFVFLVPVVSGQSLALGTASAFSDSTALAPTYNLAGVLLAATAGLALVLGITGGLAGWLENTIQLNRLIARRDAIGRALADLP